MAARKRESTTFYKNKKNHLRGTKEPNRLELPR
jgi:hypothetical protein